MSTNKSTAEAQKADTLHHKSSEISEFVSPPDEHPSEDLLKLQLSINLDLYKHHYDLFLKGVVVYLAVSGAILGYVFRPETGVQIKGLLSISLSICSISALAGGFVAKSWVKAIDHNVLSAAEKLRIKPPPLSDAKRIVLLGQILSVIIFGASLASGLFLLANK